MIREPVVAGTFYYGEKDLLIRQIKWCFSHPLGPGEREVPTAEYAIIAPHAGYMYSGPCAAWAYKSLQNTEKRRFLIVGTKHTPYGYGFSIMKEGEWKTPLGSVKIDTELAEYILEKVPSVKEDPLAHKYEHSVEVQLPFLQFLFGNDFTFVPMVIGGEFWDPAFIRKVANVLPEDVIVIASTDFTHYGPGYGYIPYGVGKEAYEKAKEIDAKMAELLVKRDIESFYSMLIETGATVCGAGAAMLAAAYAKRDGTILKYYTSAEITGDIFNFVGYLAAVF